MVVFVRLSRLRNDAVRILSAYGTGAGRSGGHAGEKRTQDQQANRRCAPRRQRRCRVLGPNAAWIRNQGLRERAQGVRRAGAGTGRVPAGRVGQPRGTPRRKGAQGCRGRHRPNQAGRGSAVRGAGAASRTYRGRSGRAVYACSRGDPLQREDRGRLSLCHGEAYLAGAGNDAGP